MSKISLTGHFVCGLNDRTGEIDVKTRNVTRFDSFNHDYLFEVFATDFARQVFIAKLYIPEIQLAPFSEVEKSVICIAMSDLKQSIWSTNAEAFYFRMFSWSSVNIDARCVDGKSSMNVMFVDQFSCQNSGSSSIFTQEHLEIQRGGKLAVWTWTYIAIHTVDKLIWLLYFNFLLSNRATQLRTN